MAEQSTLDATAEPAIMTKTLDFIEADFSATLFPLKTNRLLAEFHGQEISDYIYQKVLNEAQKEIDMTKNEGHSTAPDSLVLSDWAANVEFHGLSIEAVVHELLVLSLLYEKILVQDEVFALSDKLAGWLAVPERADLVQKLFDLGCIVILTHPEAAYPPEDDDLRNLSYKRPIAARASYLQRHSTKEERPFHPSLFQEQLYDRIDARLRESVASRRPVRSPGQPDPSERFFGSPSYVTITPRGKASRTTRPRTRPLYRLTIFVSFCLD